MDQSYVEQRQGGYWIAGTRVSLDSIIYQWREGLSPETIRESFPVLTLKQVYGAITYYLERREAVDAYLKQSEAEEEVTAKKLRATYPEIHKRFDALKESPRTRQP